jgi:hypothetical protein
MTTIAITLTTQKEGKMSAVEFILCWITAICVINAVFLYIKHIKRQQWELPRKEERSSARFYTSHDATDKPCQFYTGDDDENDDETSQKPVYRYSGGYRYDGGDRYGFGCKHDGGY